MTKVTLNDALNIPLSKCYLDTRAYNAIALEDINSEHDYRIQHLNAIPLCRIYGKRRNGCVALAIPKRTYDMLARHLSQEKLTVGDVYLNIPRLSLIPRCGKETARTIYYAFCYLSDWMSRFGVKLDISHWKSEIQAWSK